MKSLRWLLLFLLRSHAFLSSTTTIRHGRTFCAVEVAQQHCIEQVVTDDRVLDVASFRNNLMNPQMMIDRQQAKRDAIDATPAAFQGLKIGLLYIGPPLGLLQWQATGSTQEGLTTYAAIGGLVGTMLGLNNYMNKGINVPSEEEATNRMLVDFAEGLLRQQDVGFVAVSEDGKYAAARGVMAVCDGQLRNSPSSPPGVRTVAGYPPHLHIKNMLVDDDMRRQGVGRALIEAFEQYGRDETDAELVTLEVEEENIAAVNLYQSAGFEEAKNPQAFTRRTFMVKSLK